MWRSRHPGLCRGPRVRRLQNTSLAIPEVGGRPIWVAEDNPKDKGSNHQFQADKLHRLEPLGAVNSELRSCLGHAPGYVFVIAVLMCLFVMSGFTLLKHVITSNKPTHSCFGLCRWPRDFTRCWRQAHAASRICTYILLFLCLKQTDLPCKSPRDRGKRPDHKLQSMPDLFVASGENGQQSCGHICTSASNGSGFGHSSPSGLDHK